MTSHDIVGDERARRFRDLTLPCLDDAYRLAYFLMRNRTDAEDAVQECYLRALRHFDTYRGPAIKPWLLMILRNVCYGTFAKRGQQEQLADGEDPYSDWDHAFWFSQAVTLGVGTQEVLKNVVAERMLGLPRELDPTAKQPWSETKR